ncbi:hypothetical protein [Burkholderia pseudomallei]|jgi:hypothetical protein|uniref:hypothetical protein n=1 Tax=Burkholderia pseudomallei TaxID=28450 RepID=UPI0024DF33FB|nr:hypothetical protein [Burkholderia pseudomallei]
MQRVFKFEVNQVVTYNQGPTKWDKAGTGKIIGLNGEYGACLAYLIDDTQQGFKVQVTEEQITGLA